MHRLSTCTDAKSSGLTPTAQATKEKIALLDVIKIKVFCASKDTIKKVKRQPPELEELFVNHVCEKELSYLQYIKSSDNSITKGQITQLKYGFEWTFLQRKYTNGQ